jgi:putative oxidoreductase
VTAVTRARELTGQVSGTRNHPLARDLALVAARIGLGWLFIYHGGTTLFGIFGGAGLHSASIFFGTTAHLHPATFFAASAGIIEFFGGIAIAVGVLGRLAAVALVGDMVIAMATVTFSNGIVSTAPGSGYELNVALAMLALVVAILGTGRFSLDVALRSVVLRARSGTEAAPGHPAHRFG